MNDKILLIITIISMLLALINMWNFGDYKSTKIKLRLTEIENELLKLKLKNCEQSRVESSNQSDTE